MTYEEAWIADNADKLLAAKEACEIAGIPWDDESARALLGTRNPLNMIAVAVLLMMKRHLEERPKEPGDDIARKLIDSALS